MLAPESSRILRDTSARTYLRRHAPPLPRPRLHQQPDLSSTRPPSPRPGHDVKRHPPTSLSSPPAEHPVTARHATALHRCHLSITRTRITSSSLLSLPSITLSTTTPCRPHCLAPSPCSTVHLTDPIFIGLSAASVPHGRAATALRLCRHGCRCGFASHTTASDSARCDASAACLDRWLPPHTHMHTRTPAHDAALPAACLGTMSPPTPQHAAASSVSLLRRPCVCASLHDRHSLGLGAANPQGHHTCGTAPPTPPRRQHHRPRATASETPPPLRLWRQHRRHCHRSSRPRPPPSLPCLQRRLGGGRRGGGSPTPCLSLKPPSPTPVATFSPQAVPPPPPLPLTKRDLLVLRHVQGAHVHGTSRTGTLGKPHRRSSSPRHASASPRHRHPR